METLLLIKEIQMLTLDEKLIVFEETIKSIKKEESKNEMDLAVSLLKTDYEIDEELTEFTSLDFENFYETR